MKLALSLNSSPLYVVLQPSILSLVCYDFCIRWVGVVGHALYGVVDIGMSNIDITYSRYQVVDYSAWVR